MTLKEEEQRSLAALRTNRGYTVLVEKVLEPMLESALESACRTVDEREKLGHYRRYEALRDILCVLKATPQEMEQFLTEIGDEIYA